MESLNSSSVKSRFHLTFSSKTRGTLGIVLSTPSFTPRPATSSIQSLSSSSTASSIALSLLKFTSEILSLSRRFGWKPSASNLVSSSCLALSMKSTKGDPLVFPPANLQNTSLIASPSFLPCSKTHLRKRVLHIATTCVPSSLETRVLASTGHRPGEHRPPPSWIVRLLPL